jgi:rod shape-determining protein MreB
MPFWKSQEIGIDLGTATILVYVKGKGIVLNEPSVVSIDTNTKKVRAVGDSAQKMIGRTPANIVAIRPLKAGVISDYITTEVMIKYLLGKVCKKSIFKPKVVVCVPSIVTEVEKKSVIDATTNAGAKKAYLIEEPLAAALGAGVDISKPVGTMVVDIGGGTCDIAVLSLNGIVVHDSLKVAGDEFDSAIIKYIKNKYNITIGESMAQNVKKAIGCCYEQSEITYMDVKGRNLKTGLPSSVNVSSLEIMDALREASMDIVNAVKGVLERIPPELLGDIMRNGILLTGGGALLRGLDKLIQTHTGISVKIAEDAVSCVAKGTGIALENIDSLINSHL